MKKGVWTIFWGLMLLLYQIFGVTATMLPEEMGLGKYSILFPFFSGGWEIVTDATWLYIIASYILGVLSIAILIWGFAVYAKDVRSLKENNRFVDSYYAVKDLRTLAQCGVLIALYVVLDMIQIKLPFLEFTFAFIALAGIAYVAGPVTAFFCGGICEILGYFMAPQTGPLHLGITFTAMLTGLIMGIFLYQRDIKLKNIIISRCIVAFIFNLGLNTYWISTLIGKAYMAMLPVRALKCVVELPIDVLLIFLVVKLIAKINKTAQPVKTKQKLKK